MSNVPTKILKVAGKFGSYGEDGATFTPHITEDGQLSWENNKGLDNPPPINIKGSSGVYVGSGEMPEGYNVQIDPDGDPFDENVSTEVVEKAVEDYLEQNPPAKGEPGKTPVKGVDYFTPEEVQEIAERAAELVEVPSGGGIDVTGAEVGQTIVASKVDENGRPTGWMPANFPAQLPFCGCKTRLIVDLVLAADDEGVFPSKIEVTERSDGTPLNLRAFVVQTDFTPAYSYAGVVFNDQPWEFMRYVANGRDRSSAFFLDASGGTVTMLSSNVNGIWGYQPAGSIGGQGPALGAINGSINKLSFPGVGNITGGTFLRIWEIYVEE